MDQVAEIKSKLSILDVVRPYVTLKKAGKYQKALCPFHQEKSPSFFVNEDRQIAYCFSCQKGGDMFQFIQEIEGVDFRGALEQLADMAGVTLEKSKGGKPKVSKDLKDRLYEAFKSANAFFAQHLWKTEDGKKVLAYLKKRGLTEQTIREFQVGFAPNGKDVLFRELLNAKQKKEDLLEANLVFARETGAGQVWDRFRLRLMFPIWDNQGRTVAFGGRVLKADDKPKYLNSSDHPLYHKGKLLYNLHRAKSHIRERDLSVCVEGYFDVLASHQADVPNVVASSGTALTEAQFRLLKRYSKKVALAFDNDSAGQQALLRATAIAQNLEMDIYVISLTDFKDASEAAQAGDEHWVNAVESKQLYLDYFANKWRNEYDLEKPQDKEQFFNLYLDLLKGEKRPVMRDHYLNLLSQWISMPKDILYDYLGELEKKEKGRERPSQLMLSDGKGPKLSKASRLLRAFIALFLLYPKQQIELWKRIETFDSFLSEVEDLKLILPHHRFQEERYLEFYKNFEQVLAREQDEIDISSVYKAALDYYNRSDIIDEAFFEERSDGSELQKLVFQTEMNLGDHQFVSQELLKLIANIYLELTP